MFRLVLSSPPRLLWVGCTPDENTCSCLVLNEIQGVSAWYAVSLVSSLTEKKGLVLGDQVELVFFANVSKGYPKHSKRVLRKRVEHRIEISVNRNRFALFFPSRNESKHAYTKPLFAISVP